MSRTRKRIAGIAVSLMLCAVLGGCQTKHPETVVLEDQKWVVLNAAETVKPQSGIARRLVELKNYKVIDFISNTEILAYKYSETVFGEDRGLVIFNSETGKVLKTFKTKGTYFNGRLSPDKKVLAYTEASYETQLNFLDLETGDITQLSVGQKPSNGSFSKYSMDRHFRWISNEKALWTAYDSTDALYFELIEGQGKTAFAIPYQTRTKEDAIHYGLSEFDVTEDAFVGLVSVLGSNQLVKGSLKNKQVEKVLMEGVSQFWNLRDSHQLLVADLPKIGHESTLKLIDWEGKVTKTLAKVENFQGAELSNRYLTYKSYDLEKGTLVYVVDLETFTVSYVTTYLKEGLGNIKVSPDGSQLLIDFEYGRPETEGKPSSHLIELK